jgi:phage FluMu protein Com
MTAIRCPKCGRLLGYFKGEGEIQCPRCRKDIKVYFDTDKKIIEIRAS